jgi:hypothetical protein
MMTDARRDRFLHVWDLVTRPFEFIHKNSKRLGGKSPVRSSFSPSHALQLLDAGIAEPVPETEAHDFPAVPFTVVEEKDGSCRQRFILWTKMLNEEIEKAGYIPDVPLEHISKYVPPVTQPLGSLRDLACSFYQVELPPEARGLFQFRDSAGGLFRMRRLPMGHICAPELMHSVTATVGMVPGYAREHVLQRPVGAEAFVDNIRLTGPAAPLREATRMLDKRAALTNIEWKQSDSCSNSARYTFLGVDFDHHARTVKMKAGAVAKLHAFAESVQQGPVTACSIETFYGRLLHANAVLDLPLGRHYWAFKFCRRVQARLAKTAIQPNDMVPCPASFVRDVPGIIRELSSTRHVRSQHSASQHNNFNVYVDASLDGWGVVVEKVVGRRLSIFGGRWTEKAHINVLEARGLDIVSSIFDSYFTEAQIMHLYVDNTTVCAAARRKSCFANETINDLAVTFMEWVRRRDMDCRVSWVASAANPADPPSRGTHDGIVDRLQRVKDDARVTRIIM